MSSFIKVVIVSKESKQNDADIVNWLSLHRNDAERLDFAVWMWVRAT